ncbi:MAG: helix-turn-helix domain-containing protein [Isosphaeraceae bacterium]|nr:helix-turn-helix domain-containing protein [Isosphaeraceae bacterium]
MSEIVTASLISGTEAARRLDISESSFWRLVNAGKIQRVDISGTGKVGRGRKLWKFKAADIAQWIEDNTATVGEPKEVRASAPAPVPGQDALRAAGWDGDMHTTGRPGKRSKLVH